MDADDRYTRQRLEGFRWLRFSPELEKEYRENFVDTNKTRIRLAGTIGVLSAFAFVFLDQFLGMNLEPGYADLLLLGICVPALAIPLAATFYAQMRPYLLNLILFAAIGIATAALIVIIIGRLENAWFPYESLFLVTSYVYFVSGLMLYQAMFVGVALWVAFTIANWSLQAHGVLVYEVFYLFIANVLGWLGLYLLDRQARNEFLLRREVHVQALSDGLTGLMNRRAFTAHLETAWLQAQRGLTSVGVMLIDIDNFKRINDTCGHQFGDNALQHVAQVLKSCALRPLDAAARYGGDEFISVWFDLDGTWLAKLAQDLPVRLQGLQCGDPKNPVHVTISGGAVLAWPRPGMTMDDAVKAADDLLYEMKREQRGTVGFKVLRPAVTAQNQTAA